MATRKVETIEPMRLLVTQPRHYLVKIAGTGGLLMDRLFLPHEADTLLASLRGGSSGKITTEQREELLWRHKMYFREDIGVYLPGRNLGRSLREGTAYWGQKIPAGGSRTYTDLIKSALRCGDACLGSNGKPMQTDDPSIIAFGCYVTAGSGVKKVKVWCIRPMIRPWSAEFMLHAFDERLTFDVLRFVLNYAGQFKGVGAYREEFGHFELASMEEISESEVSRYAA